MGSPQLAAGRVPPTLETTLCNPVLAAVDCQWHRGLGWQATFQPSKQCLPNHRALKRKFHEYVGRSCWSCELLGWWKGRQPFSVNSPSLRQKLDTSPKGGTYGLLRPCEHSLSKQERLTTQQPFPRQRSSDLRTLMRWKGFTNLTSLASMTPAT